ncbi:hypothetical protein [Streptomyces sp. NPDC056632]|uniref:hypothetical protein n=1 Tax=Streptomyces sp. NPDC056632 TaxID=3345884 RepID=UPI00367DDF16
MDHDEELMRGRVYGQDHDDPRRGPQQGRDYAELTGGPLDGLLLDITGWSPDRIRAGAALETGLGRYGTTGRSLYQPRPDAPDRFDWAGDTSA